MDDDVEEQEQPPRAGVAMGGRSVASQMQLLRDMHAAAKLEYLRVEPSRPRRYIVDYGAGEQVIYGRDLTAWAAGFEAGLIAAKRPAGKRAARRR